MLHALVDNSTLTSVQRIIGEVPVALSFSVEGDIVAYDQYLQALLLYDELAALDDYKSEYKLARREYFKEIRFLDPAHVQYESILEQANSEMSGFLYNIEGGSITRGPLGDFLDALSLHVAPAWYMASSDWYLHLRLISDEAGVEVPKYGALMNLIQSQAVDSDLSSALAISEFSIQSSDGDYIDVNHSGNFSVRDDIRRFALALNWIAQRSYFYMLMSEHLESPFCLHPIRHAFAGQYVIKNMLPLATPDLRRECLRFSKIALRTYGPNRTPCSATRPAI